MLRAGRYRALQEKELIDHPALDNEYNSYCYVVTEGFYFKSENGKEVIVPEGFLSDGATGFQDIGCGFIFHDWLYCVGVFADNTHCSRMDADKIMVEVARAEGYLIFSHMFYLLAIVNPFNLLDRGRKASHDRGPHFLPSTTHL